MAGRVDLLIACMNGNRWAATSNPDAATTIPATAAALSPTAPDSNTRPHLESLFYSINNRISTGATAATVAVIIEHASGTTVPTTIATLNNLITGSQITSQGMSWLGIPGKRGAKINVRMNTVVGSLYQQITTAGWLEDTNG